MLDAERPATSSSAGATKWPRRDKTSQPRSRSRNRIADEWRPSGRIKVHLASEEVVELPRGCVLALEPALATIAIRGAH